MGSDRMLGGGLNQNDQATRYLAPFFSLQPSSMKSLHEPIYKACHKSNYSIEAKPASPTVTCFSSNGHHKNCWLAASGLACGRSLPCASYHCSKLSNNVTTLGNIYFWIQIFMCAESWLIQSNLDKVAISVDPKIRINFKNWRVYIIIPVLYSSCWAIYLFSATPWQF
jgi:hypothetical protein